MNYGQVQTTSDIALIEKSIYVLAGKACFIFDAKNGATQNVFPLPPKSQPDKKDIWVYLSIVDDLIFGAMGPSANILASWSRKDPRGNSKAVFAIDRKSGETKWVQNTR